MKQNGRAVREKVEKLRLSIHPDKYRLVPTSNGVDFVGFVLFADGRRRLRSANVRRFERRLNRLKCDAAAGRRDWADVTVSVRAWVAHASHAQSFGLRRAVLRG